MDTRGPIYIPQTQTGAYWNNSEVMGAYKSR